MAPHRRQWLSSAPFSATTRERFVQILTGKIDAKRCATIALPIGNPPGCQAGQPRAGHQNSLEAWKRITCAELHIEKHRWLLDQSIPLHMIPRHTGKAKIQGNTSAKFHADTAAG
ncbi:MAG TPA: hypothetical protein VHW71_09420 [Steroidobacteraceae bacterium]|jgi:hypothetical protein|nr:hypothetical protein [Steroidobacteraceae bacterium]